MYITHSFLFSLCHQPVNKKRHKRSRDEDEDEDEDEGIGERMIFGAMFGKCIIYKAEDVNCYK